MKVCHCALPSIRGNSDCCKNCSNNVIYEDLGWNHFPWIEDGKLYKIITLEKPNGNI